MAVRTGVGLFDMTSFGKIRVEGRDACAFLQRMCGNDIDVEPGRVVYTQMLNARGGIECDLTMTRTAPDSWYVVTGAAFGALAVALTAGLLAYGWIALLIAWRILRAQTRRRLRAAVAEAYDAGYLGTNILGYGHPQVDEAVVATVAGASPPIVNMRKPACCACASGCCRWGPRTACAARLTK